VHLAREGLDGQLITDAGPFDSGGIFEDVLLDSLAVIRPSANREITQGAASLRTGDGGLIVAITGSLSADAARQLAACRRDQCQAIALLLAASTWNDQAATGRSAAGNRPGGRGGPGGEVSVTHEETEAAASVLRSAGWRVISIDAGTPLAAAWRRLPRFADQAAPAVSYGTGFSPGAAR
jgi:hypothetical protein